MDKNSTKRQIMDVALDLFSKNGYEATSISEIADAVGIRKASLYSHYESKQAILEAIHEYLRNEYAQNSIFAGANWDDPEYVRSHCGNTSVDAIVAQVQWQIRYILHNPYVSKVRKLMIIEQFRNQELSKLLTQLAYHNVMNFHVGLMKYLISQGILRDGDVEVMAAQFTFPTSVWMDLCSRDSSYEEECMQMIDRHVRQFFAMYAVK